MSYIPPGITARIDIICLSPADARTMVKAFNDQAHLINGSSAHNNDHLLQVRSDGCTIFCKRGHLPMVKAWARGYASRD